MSEIIITKMPGWVSDPSILAAAVREGTQEGLRAAGEAGRSEVVRQIRSTTPHPPIDTGGLWQGVAATVFDQSPARVVIAPSPATMAHAVVMEEGRRPGAKMPPLAPIRRWVERKGIATGDEADEVAARMRRSIARKGIRGRYFFRRAKAGIRRLAKPLILRGIELALRRRGLVR